MLLVLLQLNHSAQHALQTTRMPAAVADVWNREDGPDQVECDVCFVKACVDQTLEGAHPESLLHVCITAYLAWLIT
jgi:hypothetical protein